jgi:hypothetical protein
MEHGLWPVLVALGVFLYLFGPLRHRARVRRRVRASHDEGMSAESEQLDLVERRLADLESLGARVAELENRLDFTERLVAGRREEAGREP